MTDRVTKALAEIASRSPDSFVVGGAVRDALLGKQPADVDVSVRGDAVEVAGAVAAEIGAKVIMLDRDRGHVRLAVHVGQADRFIDMTGRGRKGTARLAPTPTLPLAGRGSLEDLEADLRARDFTINAIAVPIDAWLGGHGIESAAVDPTGGIKDLRNRTVRMTSRQALIEDPVRLVRAVRFASQLGFEIESDTSKACTSLAGSVRGVAHERVREELYAMFSSPRAARGVRLCDRLGLVDLLVPEVAEGRGVDQPRNHHYYDVFEHCVRAVAKIDPVLDSAESQTADPRLCGVAPPAYPGLGAHLETVVGDGQTHRTLLRMAALLHDVAKPRCRSFDDRGRMHFYGHGELGAEMAAEILGRLRCGRRVISHVSTMVRHHLRPSQVSSPGQPPTPRALVRYFRDLDDAAVDIAYLNMADYLAARGPMLSAEDWQDYSTHRGVILNGGLEAPAQSRPFLLLDGTEVMAEFGLQPGPEVGRLLAALKAAETRGSVQTRQDALEFLRRLV